MVQGSYAATTTYNSDGSVENVNPALANLAGPMITDVNEMIRRLNYQILTEDGVLPRDINGVEFKNATSVEIFSSRRLSSSCFFPIISHR
jgi:hypothetical protein